MLCFNQSLLCQQKKPRQRAVGAWNVVDELAGCHYVYRFGASWSVLDAELDAFSLFEVSETIADDALIVDKDVSVPTIGLDEAPALHPAEPFDRACALTVHATENLLAYLHV